MSNNSGWTTAIDTPADPTSNLMNTDAPREPQYVVGNGGLEIIGNGEVTRNSPVSYTQGQDDTFDGTIMSTVKAAHGGQIIDRSPNGNDIVSIGGMTTSINAAVAAGLLVRNQDGTFSDKAAPVTLNDPTDKVAKQPEEEAPKAEPEGVSFGEEGDTAMHELMSGQNPSDLFKTVDSILQYGEMNQQTIERMASMAQIEPHEMEAKVATVWAGAAEAAADVLYEGGAGNEEAFEAFIAAKPQRQQEMIEAARNFFVHHKTEGLETMAEAYLTQMDRYAGDDAREMLADAGYAFADKPDGGLHVVIDGSKVSWEVAVKQKIITFSKA
jgi:hypothetical protein